MSNPFVRFKFAEMCIRDSNDAVQKYNVKIRSFPTNIFANMLGFEKKQQFEADSAAPVSYTHLDVYKRQVLDGYGVQFLEGSI